MKNVLIIDADTASAGIASEALKKMGYASDIASNAVDARKRAQAKKYDLILAEIVITGKSGFDLIARIRSGGASHKTNIVILSARSLMDNVVAAIRAGAVDFVVKPFETGMFLHKIGRWINGEAEAGWKDLKPEQEKVLRITIATLDKAYHAIDDGREIPFDEFKDIGIKIVELAGREEIGGVLTALKEHDSYTFVHSLRVGIFLSLFLKEYGLPRDEISMLASGGVVHDIGKAKTPLHILNKPGGFEPEEWIEMKSHVAHTVDALRRTTGIPEPVIDIAWSHHEKMNGTGYPRGLKGEEISTIARMAAIADVYVALTDQRVYKPGFEPKKAISMMRNPDHLDQNLVPVFVKSLEKLYGASIG